MTADALRRAFLTFFEGKGHTVVASSGVVPRGDATLLFANAGMVQFKDVFTGKDKRSYTRAATAQKCIRMSGKHNDLENVGRTARHHTFFEMLGNFSFGDYFKRDAITYAWEFLTQVCGIPKERLVVSVFGGEDGLPADDEARAIWKEVTGFGDDRIFGLGKADNFWSMGDTGPCGPCTEIHYAMGDATLDPAQFGQEPGPDGVGWVEIWNNVFMQFDRAADGTLTPLPSPCVDTGMGLERLCAVMQNVTSNYDTDLLRPLAELAGELAGKAYTATASEDNVSMRVMADHARLTAICLSEGVTPSNEGRGSALRSVMRRAIRHAKKLGLEEQVFYRVCDRVVDMLGESYPSLRDRRAFIEQQVRAEEQLFREKLPLGLALIAEFSQWRVEGTVRTMPGDFAHKLYATYGFPLDLTEVIGQEQGFVIDHAEFAAAKESHAEVSKGTKGSIAKGTEEVFKQARLALTSPVTFTGYDSEEAQSSLTQVIVNGELVSSANEGDAVIFVTRETPFYGESGGQVGDVGSAETLLGRVTITDTQKPVEGLTVHVGVVTHGCVTVGETVTLRVDHSARSATRRNHSATHLLHWALRKVLGSSATQRGSKVGPDTLRFDYATDRALTLDEQREIEDLVNADILANLPVTTAVTSQDEARKSGAMMIFEENYGDVVRMLHIGSESIELCGGTHASRTGDIGLFKLVSDEPLGRGVRRVMGVTGLNALALLREQDARVREASGLLKSAPAELVERVRRVIDEQKRLDKQVASLERKIAEGGTGGSDPLEGARTLGTLRALAWKAQVSDPAQLREIAEKFRDKLGSAAVLIAGVEQNKVSLVCTVSKDVSTRKNAGKIVKEIAAVLGGTGGGRPDMAQGGGSDVSKLDEAIERFYALLAAD
ncbi:MAG: alanine--tRNA ligase [Deltaproteobacteria bacterium]|nr:alanine--tRNA ligase [Deltaproteobacteria bacterium]